ncbi:MAG: hypothetical protein IJA53_10420 [Spirochaetaceae bacterium]|nr:hypothetical protein [Spirochaetaceae bacterium]MBR4012301.1 hypothetical protein [Spirochaetaceae bacterium]
MTNNLKEINDVQIIINQILPLIDEAENKFRSARNWGFFDILGGGFITDLIKHSKLGAASDIMNRINYLLHDLQRELKEVVIPTDFSMNTASFSTFADFVFDGILADVYMQSKIMTSMEQIRELRSRLLILRDKLTELSRRT